MYSTCAFLLHYISCDLLDLLIAAQQSLKADYDWWFSQLTAVNYIQHFCGINILYCIMLHQFFDRLTFFYCFRSTYASSNLNTNTIFIILLSAFTNFFPSRWFCSHAHHILIFKCSAWRLKWQSVSFPGFPASTVITVSVILLLLLTGLISLTLAIQRRHKMQGNHIHTVTQRMIKCWMFVLQYTSECSVYVFYWPHSLVTHRIFTWSLGGVVTPW